MLEKATIYLYNYCGSQHNIIRKLITSCSTTPVVFGGDYYVYYKERALQRKKK